MSFDTNTTPPPEFRYKLEVDVVAENSRDSEIKADKKKKSQALLEFAIAERNVINLTAKVALAKPNMDLFTPEDWALTIGALNSDSADEQMDTAVEAIKLNTLVKADLVKQIEKQNADALKKAEEAKAAADKAAEESKHMAWAMAGLALFAAIAITVLTAGSGVALAVGIVGIAAAGLAVANEVVKEEGVIDPQTGKTLDLSISGLSNAIIENEITQGRLSFATEEEKVSFKQDWAIAANVIFVTAMIIAGGKGLKDLNALSKAAKGVEVLGPGMQRAGAAAVATAGAVSGGLEIHSGKLGLDVAAIQEEAAKAAAKKKIFDALLRSLNADLGLYQNSMKQVMARLAENYEALSSLLAAVNNNRQSIVRINFN